MSKYEPLALFLRSQSGDSVQLTFQQIEQIIGGVLPPSAQTWTWWINSDIPSRPQAGQWLSAGWRRGTLQLSSQLVTFERVKVRYWWVNHKQTYRAELEGGYIWSPKANQNGARNQTYINLTIVRPGDVVISYAGAEIRAIGVATSSYQEQPKPDAFGQAGQNWSNAGWLVPIEWSVLDEPLRPKAYLTDIVRLLPTKNSPLQSNGNGNQACYLASISPELGSLIIGLARTADSPAMDRVLELEDELQADEAEQELQRDEELSLTEREQLIRSRVGQGAFRLHVLGIEKSCRLTGVTDERFLIASHIKPWKNCSNVERLDGENGLMLSPHVDKLFDRGWISFADGGELLVANGVPLAVMNAWGLSASMHVSSFSAKQRGYLSYHRERIFRGNK